MAGNGTTDKAKGRIKEAAGDLKGDQQLKDRGKVDRSSGSVKDRVDSAADRVKKTMNRD